MFALTIDITYDISHVFIICFCSCSFYSADEHEEFAGKARSKYIDLTLWGSFLNHTRRGLIKQPLSVFNKEEILELALEFENILDESPEYLHTEGRRGAEVSPKLKVCRQKLFKKLLVKCEEDHKIDIKVHKTLCLSTDFRSPHEYVSIVIYLP